MNYQFIKEYIDEQLINVAYTNLNEKKIEYFGIMQYQKRTDDYSEELMRVYLITKHTRTNRQDGCCY